MFPWFSCIPGRWIDHTIGSHHLSVQKCTGLTQNVFYSLAAKVAPSLLIQQQAHLRAKSRQVAEIIVISAVFKTLKAVLWPVIWIVATVLKEGWFNPLLQCHFLDANLSSSCVLICVGIVGWGGDGVARYHCVQGNKCPGKSLQPQYESSPWQLFLTDF